MSCMDKEQLPDQMLKELTQIEEHQKQNVPGSEFLAPIHQIMDSDEHFYLVYRAEDGMAQHPITKMNDLDKLEEKDVQTIVY